MFLRQNIGSGNALARGKQLVPQLQQRGPTDKFGPYPCKKKKKIENKASHN